MKVDMFLFSNPCQMMMPGNLWSNRQINNVAVTHVTPWRRHSRAMILEGMPRFSPSFIKTLKTKSLQIGCFSEVWRNALVKPFLKKLGLELVFPGFRPVSNSSFISKLTVNASVNPFSDRTNKVWPLPTGQSAYRPSIAQKQHFWWYNLIF